MRRAFRGLSVVVLGACGPAVPPATDATGAPPGPTPSAPGAGPSAQGTSGDWGVSVGTPMITAPATSQCDGRPGANLALGGTATASDVSERTNEQPGAAFDDHTGTKWVAAKNPHPWLAYELRNGQAHVVTQYAVSPVPAGSVGTDPVSFKLEGSNDPASPWITLHEHRGQRIVHRQATLWFSFQNTTAFRRYRLTITENGGGPGVELAELGLFGPGTPTFSVDDSLRGARPNEFHYGPRWEHGTKDSEFSPPKYGSSSSWNKRKDDSVSFAFVGSQVSLYGVRYPGHGIAAVSIDGGPETMVDFYGTAAGDTLFYTSPVLCPPREHTLRVRITGEKSPKSSDVYVSIDRATIVP